MPIHKYAPEPNDGFERLGPKKYAITLTLSSESVRALRYVARISSLRPRRMLDLALIELASQAYSGHNFSQIREATRTAQSKLKTPFRKYYDPEELLTEDMITYLKQCRRHGIEPDLKRAFPGSGLFSQARAYDKLSSKTR